MKKFIITTTLIFLMIVIAISILNVEFARDLPTTTTIYDIQDTYISFTIIDKTIEDKIRTSMFARGSWASYIPDNQPMSEYSRKWLSSLPLGPSKSRVIYSSKLDKIMVFQTATPISETTDDGYCYFTIEAIDATNDLYHIDLKTEFRKNQKNGYILAFDKPVKIKKEIEIGKITEDNILEISFTENFTLSRISGQMQPIENTPFDKREITIRNLKIRAVVTSWYDIDGLTTTKSRPRPYAKEINRQTEIVITFSLPMDKTMTDLLVNNELVNAAWKDDTTLVYKPSLPYPANSRIWVDIPTGHSSKTGKFLSFYPDYPTSYYFFTGK